jgi:hypothetical protein
VALDIAHLVISETSWFHFRYLGEDDATEKSTSTDDLGCHQHLAVLCPWLDRWGSKLWKSLLPLKATRWHK